MRLANRCLPILNRIQWIREYADEHYRVRYHMKEEKMVITKNYISKVSHSIIMNYHQYDNLVYRVYF